MTFTGGVGRFLALTAAGLLSSCIDGREEIWLEATGSGRANVTYSIPAAATRLYGGEAGIRRMIEEFLKNSAAISSSSCAVTTKGDRLEIEVEARFDSALDLKNISTGSAIKKLPPAANGLTGEIQAEVRGLSVDFARTVRLGDSLPGSQFIPASQLAGRHLTYIIHLPKAATDSNASRTENSGHTLIWEFPLSEALQGPITIRLAAPIPIPGWAIAAISILGILLLLLLLFILRKFIPRLDRHSIPA
jgi:hypothetical protein